MKKSVSTCLCVLRAFVWARLVLLWCPGLQSDMEVVFIQRKSCFLSELRNTNTSVLSRSRKKERPFLPLWLYLCLKIGFPHLCFPVVVCACSCFAGPEVGVCALYAKVLYHIMERENCEDDFIFEESV